MAHSYPCNIRVTSRQVDKLQLQRRRQERDNQQLLRFTETNQLQSLQNQSDQVVNAKRRANHIAQLTAEHLLDTTRTREQQQLIRSVREREQNAQLAHALEARKQISEQKEREIQRICEASEELRELESTLRTAYMNQERAQQQLHRETLQMVEKQRDVAIEQQMEYDRQRAQVEQQNNDLEKRALAIHSKLGLQQQILQREDLRHEAAAEASLEKQKVDELMRQIELEDQVELQKKEAQKEATKEMIRLAHEERIKAQRAREMEERAQEKAIQEYQQYVAAREASNKAVQEQKKANDDAKFQAVEREIRQKMKAEEEIEALRDELWEEELYQKRKLAEAARQEAKARAQAEMMACNARQLQEKAALQAKQAEEERLFNAMLQTKYASEARRDRELKAFQQKQKEIYKHEIELQNQQKQALVQAEWKREQEERKKTQEEEEFRQQVIAQAKARLLAQHKDVLDTYLPNHRPTSR